MSYYDMHGIMDITFESEPTNTGVLQKLLHSGIKKGILKIPDDWIVNGELVAVGENYTHLHCFITGDWNYIGICKSNDENHMYQQIIELNTSKGE
jgi:hypothetical protein